jgi:hypothetical protein
LFEEIRRNPDLSLATAMAMMFNKVQYCSRWFKVAASHGLKEWSEKHPLSTLEPLIFEP